MNSTRPAATTQRPTSPRPGVAASRHLAALLWQLRQERDAWRAIAERARNSDSKKFMPF